MPDYPNFAGKALFKDVTEPASPDSGNLAVYSESGVLKTKTSGGTVTSLGAAVNLASPSAIGSTTPNTGAFTTLSFAPAANTNGLSSSSYSITGSNSQNLIDLSGTWNTTGNPTGIKLNITNTAAGSSSSLLLLQTGGTNRFRVQPNGRISCGSIIDIGSGIIEFISGAYYFYNGDLGLPSSSNSFFLRNTNSRMFADSDNHFDVRRTTNQCGFRIYRTHTDASNYERLSLISTNTTRFSILAEKAGTGADRQIEVSFYTSASDPTSSDITSGCFGVWKNSGTGTIKLWANDGGTMKSVSLA
jgi:hypothetical protein